MTNNSFWTKIFSFLKKWYIFIILAIIYIPLILVVLISFNPATNRENISLNFGVPTFVNYITLWSNDIFVNGLLNTLLLCAIITPISLLIGIIASYGIWKSNVVIKSFVMNTSRLSIINPDAITGISLLILFSSTIIPMGFNFGFFTVVLAHISFCTPYVIITVYPKMIKMNPNLIMASYDLGASKFRTFRKVIIPYLAPSILSATAIVIAMSWDDFVITNLVNGSWQTIGTAIYMTRKGIKAWVITFGAIMILITILVIMILSIIKFKRAHFNKNKKLNRRVYNAN